MRNGCTTLCLFFWYIQPCLSWTPVFSLAGVRLTSQGSQNPFETLRNCQVVDPQTGDTCAAVDESGGQRRRRRQLVVLMPQLGDFDSSEYAEMLVSVLPDLESAGIDLRVVGVGTVGSAKKFCGFSGLPLEVVRVDPKASVHAQMGCHRGPDWDVPSFLPDALLIVFAKLVGGDQDGSLDVARSVARAWLNYMAMCAGIAAPGTLREILRGYLGDKTAPERLRNDETVTAGPISVTGVRDVKIGPIEYQSLWKDEKGYQRPAELATVRLRAMVEILSNLNEYVPDQRFVDWRGATYLFESDGTVLYEYKDRGVLTYSKTMARPLSFLAPYIGDQRARNPLGLADPTM